MCQALCWQFIFITSVTLPQPSEAGTLTNIAVRKTLRFTVINGIRVSAPERSQAQVTWFKNPHLITLLTSSQLLWEKPKQMCDHCLQQTLPTHLIAPRFRLRVSVEIKPCILLGEPGMHGEGKSWGKEHFSGDSLNPFALCMHRHAHSRPGYLTKLISN